MSAQPALLCVLRSAMTHLAPTAVAAVLGTHWMLMDAHAEVVASLMPKFWYWIINFVTSFAQATTNACWASTIVIRTAMTHQTATSVAAMLDTL